MLLLLPLMLQEDFFQFYIFSTTLWESILGKEREDAATEASG
jgi:hypothetical protein